jgi:hypothetical protein
MPQRRHALVILAAVSGLAMIAVWFVPPIPQPTDYHNFVDTRTFLGIPNFSNVVSNLPFLLVGVAGLLTVISSQYAGGLPSQRFTYGIFFVSVIMIGFGSAWYHWLPNNETLIWDRLPMAIGFMALASIVIAEHLNERVAKLALWPLITLGIVAVTYWAYTESTGHGDLRFYGLVQFLTLILIGLTWLLVPSRLTGIGYLWLMFAGYVLAKAFEAGDAAVFEFLGHTVSGHALKHVSAAAGMYCLVLALRRRRIRESRDSLWVF